MQRLKHYGNRIITLVMEAGVFFFGLMSPVFAQDLTIEGGAEAANPGTTDKGLFDQGGIFQTISRILIFLIGAVSVIMLIVGGFRYVLSGGDSTSVEGAKNTILYAIVGLVVAFLSFAAIEFIIQQLSS